MKVRLFDGGAKQSFLPAPRLSRSSIAWLGKEIDKVAVGIAKKHCAVAPRHICRREDPLADAALQARVVCVDVLHFEIKDKRTIGAWREHSVAVRLRRGSGSDRQTRTGASLKFNVAAAQDLGCCAGHAFIKTRKPLHVCGDKPALFEIHGCPPSASLSGGRTPDRCLAKATTAPRCWISRHLTAFPRRQP